MKSTYVMLKEWKENFLALEKVKKTFTLKSLGTNYTKTPDHCKYKVHAKVCFESSSQNLLKVL